MSKRLYNEIEFSQYFVDVFILPQISVLVFQQLCEYWVRDRVSTLSYCYLFGACLLFRNKRSILHWKQARQRQNPVHIVSKDSRECEVTKIKRAVSHPSCKFYWVMCTLCFCACGMVSPAPSCELSGEGTCPLAQTDVRRSLWGATHGCGPQY